MKVYFGEIDNELAEELAAGGSESFEQDDKYFEYVLTMEEEAVKITDAIGRYVVFGHADIPRLIEALEVIQGYSKALADVEKIYDAIHSDNNIWVVTSDE